MAPARAFGGPTRGPNFGAKQKRAMRGIRAPSRDWFAGPSRGAAPGHANIMPDYLFGLKTASKDGPVRVIPTTMDSPALSAFVQSPLEVATQEQRTGSGQDGAGKSFTKTLPRNSVSYKAPTLDVFDISPTAHQYPLN